jgi:hypothetical protein
MEKGMFLPHRKARRLTEFWVESDGFGDFGDARGA